MKKRIEKRMLAWMLTFAMVLSMIPVTAFAEETSESTECTHSHDETCGYVEAVEEVPCDQECTDTDGDGLIDHAEECAYTPAVEGQPCTHVHDENCGGVIVKQSEKDIEAETATEDTSDREESLQELIALLNELADPMAYLAQGTAQESILDRDQLANARAAVDSWLAGEEAASSGSEEEREQLQSLIVRLEGLEHIRDTETDCLDVDCPYHYPEIIQEQMAENETPKPLTLDDLVEDYGVEPPMQTFSRLRSAAAPHPQTLMLTEDNENNSHTGSSDGDIDVLLRNTKGTHPIELSFTLDALPTQSAYLAVKAYDVDEDSGETDYVYINDDIFLPKDKTNSDQQSYHDSTIGYLSGTNNTWNTTILRIPLEKLKVGKNTISVTIASGWVVNVDWMQLVLDGGAVDSNIEEFSLKLENSATSGNNVTVQASVTVKQTGNLQYTTEYTLTQNKTGNALDACFGTVSASETIELSMPLNSPSGIYTITGILKESETEAIKATDSISFYFTQGQGLGPKINHTLTPAGLTNQDVTITVSAEGASEAGITNVSISDNPKTVSGNGSYSFTVNYTLNENSQSVTYPVKVDTIDKQQPTIIYSPISVLQDEAYDTVQNLFADALLVSDNVKLASEPLSYTIPQDISKTGGEKTITVTATDAAGNIASQNCTITVIAKPVKLTLEEPAPVSGSKDSYTLTAVLENGSDTITETGFVWGVMPNPTLELNNGSVTTASAVTATGQTLTGTATGLLSGVEYYARAYAKVTENDNTTVVYSEAKQFGLGIPSYGTFSVSSVSGSTFTITRTGGTDGAQTVYYRTVNGSAISGTHFIHQASTLTFKDGETSKTVTVAELDVTSAYNSDAGTQYSNADRTYSLEIYRVEGGGAIDQSNRSKTRTMTKDSSYTIDRSFYNDLKQNGDVAQQKHIVDRTSDQGATNNSVNFTDVNRDKNYNWYRQIGVASLYSNSVASYLNATNGYWLYRFAITGHGTSNQGYQDVWFGYQQPPAGDLKLSNATTPSSLTGQIWFDIFDFTTSGCKAKVLGNTSLVQSINAEQNAYSTVNPNGYAKNDSLVVAYKGNNYGKLETSQDAWVCFSAHGNDKDDWYIIRYQEEAILQDANEPALLGVAPMAGGTYLPGDPITVALVFDEIVDDTNSTLISSVSINTNVGTLTYAGGADTNVLYFTGTVASNTGNLSGDNALQVTGINNSSYIKDMCSTAGTASTATSGSANVIVDATIPEVTITANTSGSLPQHKATITATNASTLQYAWTQSTDLPAYGWRDVDSGTGTQLTESRGTAGETKTWYLHVLATSSSGATTHAYKGFSFMQPDITAVSVLAGTSSTSADVADVWKPSKYIVVGYEGAQTSGTTLTFAGPQTSSQTITAASGTASLQVTKNGIYTITLKDSYGNVISKTIEVKKIDADNPKVTLRSGNSTDGNTVYNSLSIAVLPEDAGGSGLAKVEYAWTNTTDAPSTWGTLTAASDGSYQAAYTATESEKTAKYLHVKVTDGAGNVSDVVTSGPYQVIQAATGSALPSITVTVNPAAWTNSAALTWTATNGTGTGAGAIQTVYTPDGAVNGSSTTGTCTVTKNGIYQFVVIDANGNSASAEVLVTNVDSEAPKLTSLIAQAGHTNGTITLAGVTDNCTILYDNKGNYSSLSGSGIKTRQYKLESESSWTTFTGDIITVTKNGTYTIKLTDQVGNSREYSVEMDGIDATAPKVTCTINATANAGSGWYTTPNLSVVLNFADEAGAEGGTPSGIQSVQYKWETGNTTKPTSGLTSATATDISNGTVTATLGYQGTWYLYYKVTDNKGSVTEGFSDAIKKDTFEPTSAITGPTKGQPISSGLAMKWKITYGPSGGRITAGTDAASATLLDTFDQSTGTDSRTKTVDYTAKTTGTNDFRFYKYAANGATGTSSYNSWPFYVRQIIFNSQGGSTVEPQLVWHKSQTSTELVCAVTKPSDPTRTGYIFGGWYTDAACTDGNRFDFDNQTQVKANTTLYAKWTAAAGTSYKVNHYTEDLTGGTWTLQGTDNKTGTTGATLTLSGLAKSILGFTYKEGKIGDSVVIATTILANGSRVIDLYYSRNTYTLTLNKGMGISGVSGAGSYKYGQSVSVDAAISAGYTWQNWTGDRTSTDQKFSFTMPASNVTLTANATINQYTVTFSANGHGTAPGSQTVNYGGKAAQPAALTATGYVFDGWYTDAACTDGKQFDFDTQVKANITLYAKWTPAAGTSYKVNHYTEDLTGGTWTRQGTDNKTGTTDTTLTLSGLAKSIPGFTYKEGKVNGSVVTSTTILADGSREIDLYYTRNTYTVTYHLTNPDGGTYTPGVDLKTYTYGQGLTLPVLTQDGFAFSGWYDNAGYTGTKYTVIGSTETGKREYYAYYQDVTIPSISVSADGYLAGEDGWWRNNLSEQVKLAVTYSDNVKVTELWVKTYDGEYTKITTSDPGQTFSYTALQEGTHTYTFKAVDAAGNENTDAVTIKLDTGKPKIGTITCEKEAANIFDWIIGKDSLIIHIPVTDNTSGVKTLTYTETPSGGTAVTKTIALSGTTGEQTADVTLNADWKGTITNITCTDNAGNVSVSKGIEGTNGIIVENNAPVITITEADMSDPDDPKAGGAVSQSYYDEDKAPTLYVAVKDEAVGITAGIQSISYRINGDTAVNVTGSFTTALTGNWGFTIPLTGKTGVVNVEVTAVDHAGNTANSSVVLKIKGKEATPEAQLNYRKDALTNLVPGASYEITISNGESSVTITCTADEKGEIPFIIKDENNNSIDLCGKTIAIVRKGDGKNSTDSVAQGGLSIAERPDALDPKTDIEVTPELAPGAEDAEIIININVGSTDRKDREYSTDGGNSWISVPKDNIIKGLKPGNVIIRDKADGDTPHGKEANVIIPESANTITVVFDLNYDNSQNAPTNQTGLKYTDLLTKPDAPARDGYDFVGWYKDSACQEEVIWNVEDSMKIQTGNIIHKDIPNYSLVDNIITVKLYAKWRDNVEPNLSAVLSDGMNGQNWYNNLSFTLTYSDNVGVKKLYVKTDNADYAELDISNRSENGTHTNGSSQYQLIFDGLEEGSHTYTFKAVDAAGNKTETAAHTAKLDTTIPALGDSSFNEGYRNLWDWIIRKDSLIITIPVTETGSGIEAVTYTQMPENGQTEEKTATLHAVTGVSADYEAKIYIAPDFKGRIAINAKDKAENVSLSKTIGADGTGIKGIIVEDNAPVITILADRGITDAESTSQSGTELSTDYYNSAPKLLVKVKDDNSNAVTGGLKSVTWKLDNGAVQNVNEDFQSSMKTQCSFTISDLQGKTGSLTVTVNTEDHAGNTASKSVTVHIKGKEEKPNPAVDYQQEKMTNLLRNAAYVIEGENLIEETITADDQGCVAIKEEWFGKNIQISKRGGTTTLDSEKANVSIASRPAAPSVTKTDETIKGKQDGTLTGVSTTMDYSVDGGISWTSINESNITEGRITGLEPCTIQIRKKATTSAPHGEVQTVIIAEGRTLTVTFVSNSGSDVSSITGKSWEDTVAKPEDPLKAGYTFEGWYRENTFETIWHFAPETGADKLTDDVTLYAKWTLNKPSVTLTADGGTINPVTGVIEAVYNNGNTLITLTTEPSHAAAPEGSSSNITYTYQWYRDDQKLTDMGSTAVSLTLTDVNQSGTYTVKVTAWDGEGRTSEAGSSNEVTVNIAKAPSTFTVSKNTHSYDTTAKTAVVEQTAGQTPHIDADGYEVSYEQNGNKVDAPKDAGTYDVMVTLIDDNFSHFGQSDSVTKQKVGELIIKKKLVTAVWTNLTAEYNGTAQAPVCTTLVGLMEADAGQDVAGRKYVSADLTAEQRLTNAGTKRLTATLAGTRADNYQLTNAEVNFTVQKAPVTFAVADHFVQADGHSHSATVSAYVKGEAFDTDKYTITYRNAAGQTVDEPTDAGTYGIYAKLTDANYRHSGTAEAAARQIGVLTIYRNQAQTPKTYTVKYASGAEEASEVTGDLPAEQKGLSEGTLIYLPGKGTLSRTGYAFTGWILNGKQYQPGETFTMPAKNVTITACWKEATYRISGVVDQEGKPLPHAVVTLKRGAEIIGETTTDTAGKYSFVGVIPGLYNLITSYDGIITTVKVLIVDEDAEQNATLPAGRTNSILDVMAGAPAVVVGNLEKLFQISEGSNSPAYPEIYTDDDKNVVETGGTVEIRLTVEKVAEPDQTGADLLKEAMKKLPEAFEYQTELYLDLVLQKTVYSAAVGGSGSAVTKTLSDSHVILESVISLPSNLQNRRFYKVYRIHQNAPGDIVLEELTEQPNTEGEYFELNPENTEMTIHARKYSVYSVAASDYVAPQPANPESSEETGEHFVTGLPEETIQLPEEEKKAKNSQINENPLEKETKLPEESDAETEKPEVIPENILKEEVPVEETIINETIGKPFVLLNVLLTLLSLAIAALMMMSRQEKKLKIAVAIVAVISLLILLLTLGFHGVRLADLRTILFAVLVAAQVILGLTGINREDKKEEV